MQGRADAGDVLGLGREHRPDQLLAGQPGPRRLLRRGQGRGAGADDQNTRRCPTSVTGWYFDGIMNWNKLGWLADKFASHDCAVLLRPVHPQCVLAGAAADRRGRPILGMAQHYLLCPTNHGFKTLQHLPSRIAWTSGSTVSSFDSHAELPRVHRPPADPGRHRSARSRSADDVLRRRRRRRSRSTRTRSWIAVEAMLEAIDVRRLQW